MEEEESKQGSTSLASQLTKVDDSQLTEATHGLVQDIMAEDDPQKLQELYDKFTISQSKKDFLSSLVYNQTIDKTVERVFERVDRFSDNLSTKDLLDIIRVMSDERMKASKSYKPDSDKPLIQVNSVRNNVNVTANPDALSRESKERVMSIIKDIIGKDMNWESNSINDSTIDLTDDDDTNKILEAKETGND